MTLVIGTSVLSWYQCRQLVRLAMEFQQCTVRLCDLIIFPWLLMLSVAGLFLYTGATTVTWLWQLTHTRPTATWWCHLMSIHPMATSPQHQMINTSVTTTCPASPTAWTTWTDWTTRWFYVFSLSDLPGYDDPFCLSDPVYLPGSGDVALPAELRELSDWLL